MDLRETGCEDGRWKELTQDRVSGGIYVSDVTVFKINTRVKPPDLSIWAAPSFALLQPYISVQYARSLHVRNVSSLCNRGSYYEDHRVSVFVVGLSWAHSAVFPNFPLCVLCLKSSHSQQRILPIK
jgi:hypothetical protein